jgi:NAD(P)-dependent dehydrogenase (short-subunit alcohol dehydrogenase family)
MKGRVALVTGAAVRVGREIALGLARDGMRVVIHYHTSEREAGELVDEIRALGSDAAICRADLADMRGMDRLVDEAEAAFGGIDVLVNSASVFPSERLGDVDAELWDHTMAVNLRAPFFLTQKLGARMRQRGGGVIINMCDLAGMQAWDAYAAHAISKAGLIHLTKIAARALAPEVRVNGIAPGTVLPPEGTPPEEIEKLARRSPLGRIGSPADVVDAIRYLIGAEFVTGEVLVLDGGRTLRS